MARSAAKCAGRAWPGHGHANLLLGGGHNARALFVERRLDALLVFQALLLHLRGKLLDLLAQPGQLGLHRAQPRLGIRRGLARAVKSWLRVCERLRKIFGMMRAERNGDGEKDDGEVDAEQKMAPWYRASRCRMRATDCTTGACRNAVFLLVLGCICGLSPGSR